MEQHPPHPPYRRRDSDTARSLIHVLADVGPVIGLVVVVVVGSFHVEDAGLVLFAGGDVSVESDQDEGALRHGEGEVVVAGEALQE